MIDLLSELLNAELSYASFNARRTASDQSGAEEIGKIAGIPFVCDKARPESEYYNRAVIPPNLDSLEELLHKLPATVRAIELQMPQQTEEFSAVLIDAGFVPSSSLCYLVADPIETEPAQEQVKELEPGQTDYLFDLLERSGASFSAEKRNATRHFYCTDQFRCFVSYNSENEPTGWATMFVNEGSAFLANAFSLPEFRGRGFHSALLAARLAQVHSLGLRYVFTDVVPASQSHRNCVRHGFRILSVNNIWKRKAA